MMDQHPWLDTEALEAELWAEIRVQAQPEVWSRVAARTEDQVEIRVDWMVFSPMYRQLRDQLLQMALEAG